MSTAKRSWTTFFFSIGAITTLVCIALVLAGNTEALYRFEHRGFPLAWAFAGAAILAFMLAEFFDDARKEADEPVVYRPQYTREWTSPEVELEGDAS